MHLVGLYTYCRMMHGAYSVKLIHTFSSILLLNINSECSYLLQDRILCSRKIPQQVQINKYWCFVRITNNLCWQKWHFLTLNLVIYVVHTVLLMVIYFNVCLLGISPVCNFSILLYSTRNCIHQTTKNANFRPLYNTP